MGTFAENLEPNRDDIAQLLMTDLKNVAEKVAPDFVRNMPQAYFNGTTQSMRLAHLKAILAAEASGLSQTLTLRDADASHYTFISNQSFPGQLGDFVQRLPLDMPLVSAHVYTANDKSRVLDVFRLGEHACHDPSDPHQVEQLETVLKQLGSVGGSDNALLRQHLKGCGADYLRNTPVKHIARHYAQVNDIRADGNVLVRLYPDYKPNLSRLTIGIIGYDPRKVFERIARHLGNREIDIQLAHLDSFGRESKDNIYVLSFLVQCQGQALVAESQLWQRLEFELRRLPHLDDQVFMLARQVTQGSLCAAEILLVLSRISQQRLVKRDPFVYTRERMISTMVRYPLLANEVAQLMQEHFEPEGHSIHQRAQNLATRVQLETDKPEEGRILSCLIDAVLASLRSNHRLPHRHSLALRVNPAFFNDPSREVSPFAVFYVHAAGFDGFHVRFRDIARGGVRIVRPRSLEQYALENERHFDEVYGLAFAQQHKNKDIPEGGAKGVILAMPGVDFDGVGRSYTDGLLDLIVPDSSLFELHADHYNNDELLYLGPDENISNQLISWIVKRAHLRGHPMPNAFMSSKPGAGINHKEHGVTSEGVTVFLDAALRAVGIVPEKDIFTVKMTGGPDGDVAGNEILILQREYGERVRILGIADGTGCAEDPDGLDIKELVRLVKASAPIVDFSRDCLGPSGRVVSVDDVDGLHLRNSLHNRIKADAFVPAGGRPGTINENNWQDYVGENGEPSSRVIVEGANLFVTPEAREHLSEVGVLIIKDSSANKAGVICSSYEIIAGMLLGEPDFLQIKERYVQEVIDKLREFARIEARALFAEHRKNPSVALPKLSMRLSYEINRCTEAIIQGIDQLFDQHSPLIQNLVVSHMPRVLVDTFGDQLMHKIPRIYLQWLIAGSLASKMVYREGLAWLEALPNEGITSLASRYLVQQEKVQTLVEQVLASDLEDREAIAKLLEEGGVTAALKDVD